MTVPDPQSPAFAISVQADGYSSARSIVGRVVAGETFLRGIGRTWPRGVLQGVATGTFDRDELFATLRDGGFQGEVRLSNAANYTGAGSPPALYYPAVPHVGLARLRNRVSPGAYSLFGVTHTISTGRSLDAISAMAAAPFMPWDALICTSRAALAVVTDLFDETHESLRRGLGATRLERPQTPVIPLGVNLDRWRFPADDKARARATLGIAPDEVAFLFAGRLSFHSKANPAALYQGLQSIAGAAKVVCIEAGLYPTEVVRGAYRAAQAALAPDIRFIHAAGDNSGAYAAAWRAADVFTSLSDNVQETFGLTPVEALAAGLPVVASDWNGYRDNIRDGVDGFLIPTRAAPPGAGEDLGHTVDTEALNHNRQIGLLSLGVTVDRTALHQALVRLATDGDLRAQMGAAARRRAADFDWPVVMQAYDALARELSAIRLRDGAARVSEPWVQRRDPYSRFQSFATGAFGLQDVVSRRPDSDALLTRVLALELANYSFSPAYLPTDLPRRQLDALSAVGGTSTAEQVLTATGGGTPAGWRALAWLCKFGIVEIAGPPR